MNLNLNKAGTNHLDIFKYRRIITLAQIESEYLVCPSVKNKTVILSDPMLASGASIITALDVLKTRGNAHPTHTYCALNCKSKMY